MEPSDAERRHSAAPPRSPWGGRIIAALLVYLSFRVLFSEVTDNGFTDSWATSLSSDPILAILKLATVCVGSAVALGVWSTKRWAFWSYLIWVPFYVGVALVGASRVESVIWKLAIGVAPVSILAVFGAAYLYKKLA